jgi:2-deoxy-D-gluconate 3-dehydrogenase
VDEFRLEGKVALVTGASRGIGRAIALGLGRAGATLALASRTVEALESCAAEAEQFGTRALALPTDVADLAQIQDMVTRTVDAFGRLDVLVNVAGINRRGPAVDLTEADWDAVIDTNLKAVFFACQAAGRVMLAQRSGSIITIGSLTSTIGIRRIAPYAASKHGILGLTKVLATEWAPHGVRVNVLSPGYIETDLTAPLKADPSFDAWVRSRIPMGYWGQPSDLVGAAIFLASDASRYVTGQMLNVDGGWLAS